MTTYTTFSLAAKIRLTKNLQVKYFTGENIRIYGIKSHIKTYQQLPLTLMCICQCLKYNLLIFESFILNTLKLSKCNTTHVCNISYGNKVRSSKVTDDSSTGADTHMTNERNKPPETGTILSGSLASSPGPLRGGGERAWYTLFAHAQLP